MNPNRNMYLLIAGGINLFTAILHTIGGQLDLVNPLMNSNLTDQQKAEWIAAWHLVTIMLFFTSYVIIKNGLGKIRYFISRICRTIYRFKYFLQTFCTTMDFTFANRCTGLVWYKKNINAHVRRTA
jgi:hypothetical protein